MLEAMDAALVNAPTAPKEGKNLICDGLVYEPAPVIARLLPARHLRISQAAEAQPALDRQR